jgi:succinyl-diaminopimelate desuccinylase
VEDQIIELASELIRIPSRAGIDSTAPILEYIKGWLGRHDLPVTSLKNGKSDEVGVYIHLASGRPGPAICLNACIDTAPFGDESAWSASPASGHVASNRLYGRGAADSKMGVAIFSNLAVDLIRRGDIPGGDLFVVFDADEHTGAFQGIKTFLENSPRKPDAALIGYPGNDALVVGSRGFLRAVITVFGRAAHSGSSSVKGYNAVEKMARLVARIHDEPLPPEADRYFGFGPQANVTEIAGGQGFSIIPDRCTCKVDIRLTPGFNLEAAGKWVEEIVRRVDQNDPGPRPSRIDWREGWPPYRVNSESFLVTEFLRIASEVFGRPIHEKVSGPSNIGNHLASRGIPALSGFGATYWNIHGIDECVDLETVAPVYETYHQLIRSLLASGRMPLASL